MKFLCPSCKAKYQISDEKVAGRSVRMKCRKCGHVIQVSSDDAIAGSSAPPPPVDDVDGEPAGKEPAPASAAQKPGPPEKPKPVAGVPRVGAPAAPSAAKSRVPAPKSAPAASESAAKPVAPTAPRVGAEKVADAPRIPRAPSTVAREAKSPAAAPVAPVAPSAATVARAPAKPQAAAPVPAAVQSPTPAPAPAASPTPSPAAAAAAPRPAAHGAGGPKLFDEDGEEEATQIARGALIGAFSAAVKDHAPASVADPLSMPGDEWFVGINGVPVGPIRLSELRAKAASGAVTKESLVWRDGFEEWRPLKSFPELVAIVEESLSSARASMPFAMSPASAGTLADPFAGTAPATSATPAAVAEGVSFDELQALRARPRTSPAAWLAVVVAVAFGLTLGAVIFGRGPAAQTNTDKPAEKPVNAAPSAAAPAQVAATEQKPEEQVISGDTKAQSKGPTKSTTTKTDTETKTTKTGGLGLSGLAANGTRGPSDGPGSTTQGGPGGGQLDQAQLSGVVQRYTPSVKRSCWQPALDGRDKDAPSSARVSVAITISPSGSVQDVNASGDPKGYRGLAQCIAGRVRGWQFPPSGGSTTVNVPFVFVAQ